MHRYVDSASSLHMSCAPIVVSPGVHCCLAVAVQVTDDGIPPMSYQADVTITIADVNEPPTAPTLDRY